MTNPTHLTLAAQAMLERSLEDRITYALEDQWIGYTRAQQALDTLNDLINHPPSLRMPSLLLVGESGNGKSTIVEKFKSQHPVATRSAGEALIPVVVVEMPSEPSETRFWTELLLALSIAHRDSDPVQRKKNQALSVLTYVGCRMLVIDEVHNVLFGRIPQQRQFLGVLKNLSNDLKLPIVAVGTREAIRTLHTDPQLSSRFEAFGLPRWALDREFLRLLVSFERVMPLPAPSGLTDREMAAKLHGLSGGTIGGLSRILKKAAVYALRKGRDRIAAATLDEIDWVRLADYGKQADRL